jgi:hypothetical protein
MGVMRIPGIDYEESSFGHFEAVKEQAQAKRPSPLLAERMSPEAEERGEPKAAALPVFPCNSESRRRRPRPVVTVRLVACLEGGFTIRVKIEYLGSWGQAVQDNGHVGCPLLTRVPRTGMPPGVVRNHTGEGGYFIRAHDCACDMETYTPLCVWMPEFVSWRA